MTTTIDVAIANSQHRGTENDGFMGRHPKPMSIRCKSSHSNHVGGYPLIAALFRSSPVDRHLQPT
jgi:hypothetical protein